MTSILRWLAHRLAFLLEPNERDAVLGDFAEVRMSDSRAIAELVGLVMRRQIEVWAHWRPWFTFLCVAAPLGVMFGILSRQWAYGSAIDAWLYLNQGEWGYLSNPGWRKDLFRIGMTTATNFAALGCWSWTTGFLLGSASRRSVAVNGTIFCFLVFVGSVATAPLEVADRHAAVFSSTFYRSIYPELLRSVLILIPGLWGMQQGYKVGTLRLIPASLWMMAVLGTTLLAAKSLQYSVIFGWLAPPPFVSAMGISPLEPWLRPGTDGAVGTADDVLSWHIRLLPLAVTGPAVYMFVTASRRHWQQFQSRVNSHSSR